MTAFRRTWRFIADTASPARFADGPVQLIVYASNETNYCAECRTGGGKRLADRALSRLLEKDWPGSIGELETRKRRDENA